MQKLKKKLTITLMFLISVLFSLHAQTRSYSGQVTDEANGEPLTGVTVKLKNSNIGTLTDINGKFSIKAKQNDVLSFSYIGYASREVTLSSNNELNIQLKENSKQLDEVVVVGYGVQKKATAVGSYTSTKGEELLKVGNVNTVSEALQGMMPGVVTINTNSKPGADAADIYIRGRSTWVNSSPLVLVDGIERSFNDIDINEIENISVLKDASATAVFGVKGGNGVIIITTKRGSTKHPEISFTANFGIKEPGTSPSYADYPTAMKIFNEAQRNDLGWSKLIPESTITAWENAYATGNYGPYNDVFPQVDWWNEAVQTGYEQNYNINISGGTEKMKYFTSLGYLNDGDIFKGAITNLYDASFNFKRYNWRSNFDFNLTNTTQLSLNIAGNMGYRNQPAYRPSDSGISDDGYFFKWLYEAPSNTFPIKYSDGNWGDSAAGGENIFVYLNATGSRNYKRYQGFYDVFLNQQLNFITPGLSAKATVSYTSNSQWVTTILKGKIYGYDDLTSINSTIRYNRVYDYSNPITNADGTIIYPLISEKRLQNDNDPGDMPIGGSTDAFVSYGRKLYYELALNYNRAFGDHKVTGLFLFSRSNEYSTSYDIDFPSLEEDWVGRITYNYLEKYLLELNGCVNGSEKFAPGKRFGFFPSASVGWRISEEKWFKNWTKNSISNLKLRYSYGQVGNDKGANRFNYLQLFTAGTGSQANSQFGLNQNYNWGPIYLEGTLADLNSTWEVSVKNNLGIDFGLWNKLNVSVDLFTESRDKILMTRNTIPAWLSSGVSLPTVNLGKTKSHGLEVELSWNDKIDKFRYYLKLNFATSENRIVFRDDAYDLPDYMKYAGKIIGYQSRYIANGNFTSIDDIFNSAQSAIANGSVTTVTPGDLYYMDYNGDGVIDSNDKVPMKYSTIPLTTAGLTVGGDYHGFGFNMLFYTALGVYKDAITDYLYDFPAGNIKAQPNTLERWTYNQADAIGVVHPSVHINDTYNEVASTYNYTNHSYLRLKNLEVNYAIPKKLVSRFNLERFQVYVNANNLFTISPADSRRDPETDGQNVYPIIKRYNIGFRLGW